MNNNELTDLVSMCKLTDAVESAISIGPMDPIHAYDRFAYRNSWHMEPPSDSDADYYQLQGRRSCAVRAVNAVLELLSNDLELSKLVKSKFISGNEVQVDRVVIRRSELGSVDV